MAIDIQEELKRLNLGFKEVFIATSPEEAERIVRAVGDGITL